MCQSSFGSPFKLERDHRQGLWSDVMKLVSSHTAKFGGPQAPQLETVQAL